MDQLYRTYITACHVLHSQKVLDAYGHLSVRHPDDSSKYIMARYLPPALVSSPNDLIEYWVADSEPVDVNAPKGYSERFIHGEVLKRYPEVNSVIHSHSKEIVPFGLVSNVQFRPCTNTAGFLGNDTPIYDIRKYFKEGDVRDLLVRSEHTGAALASYFSDGRGPQLDRSLVLMRGHGMTVAAPAIEHCVFRAVYAQRNAEIQTTALSLSGGKAEDVNYLDELEVEDCSGINMKTVLRPWSMWKREVEEAGLYINLA